MYNLINLSSNELEKELYKENIFIELSERLEIEMSNKNISSTELSEFLGKDNEYIDMILDGLVDIKLSELAYIFAFFGKFTGIAPVSKSERIAIIDSSKHSFATFNEETGRAKLCTKHEFITTQYNKIHTLSIGSISTSKQEKFYWNKHLIHIVNKIDFEVSEQKFNCTSLNKPEGVYYVNHR
ncbi:hypothetical protein RO21_08895 [[Actinobacillus] muris]|uniref:Uncharacterized protein n=1 Tax=Muribacter muris TaxID=67855 RepID=A0A0J5P3Y4_9PAST|nr:hypothetical protein [Muribacter muris]KMK51001.1 hypothetical protein RO21_08895 [[Actinobacillus] muris] [Muribacter muris]